MVRLAMIRHGHSVANAHMEAVMERARRGEIATADVNKALRDAPPGAEAGADAALSGRGEEQAELLAEAWAPLLEAKARRGQLRVFVSPYLRTLQTADALMRRLRAAAPGLEAAVLPAIMEAAGLVSGPDFQRFDELDRLRRSGRKEEAVERLKSFSWEPMGLTGREIARRFPWARAVGRGDEELFPGVEVGRSTSIATALPMETPWWTGGFESSKRTAARLAGVAAWIDGTLRAALPDGALVVFVTHGQAIEMLSRLLAEAAQGRAAAAPEGDDVAVSFSGIRNTSVTVLTLPSPDYSFRGERPNASGHVERFRARFEVFNDTSHLGLQPLRQWAADTLSAKL